MSEIIRIQSVRKTFSIPHERRTSLRDHVVNLFRRSEYEKLNVLNNISLSVSSGEFIGIVGRNGSGKSTLLKLIAGVYPPTQGHVRIQGSISPLLELGVGFNPELSARDNIYLYGTVLGIRKKRLQSRFNSIIEFAELARFVDTKLKNFSSGMVVRLAFSIAIEVDADIYLLDEVLAVGDQDFQRKCFQIFEKLKAEGKTVVLVSHNLQAISHFCSRALYLKDGMVHADGSVEEVIRQYNSDNT